jgi:anti-sigma factor RsiW
MSAHPAELLALAAAGALDAADAEQVRDHVAQCPACAGELESWSSLARELASQPPPRPSPDLVVRTLRAVERQLAERQERAWNRAALGFLVAFGWMLMLIAWVALDLVSGGIAAWFARPVESTAAWYAAYLAAGWLTSGAAAVLLGRKQEERIV